MPVPADVTIRPMLLDDAEAAAGAGYAALSELYPELATPEQEGQHARDRAARAAHLQQTDPGGCWVADVDGRVVGTALSLIRDGLWGFSLFGILPAFQGQGIGGPLYARALAYGAGERGAIILSSSHPAAMRSYARSPGFKLLPTVGLAGIPDRTRAPRGLRHRPGDLVADRATIEAASAHVRGASHARDLPTLLERPGSTLLVVEGGGFVVSGGDSVRLLAATDEDAAADLLWGAILASPGPGGLSYDFVTAENQWAIRVGLEAGLALKPDGPVFVRGRPGPLAPYLPSGSYL